MVKSIDQARISLAVSAHGTVHASEIAYAIVMRIVERTIASESCFASDGDGCDSVL